MRACFTVILRDTWKFSFEELILIVECKFSQFMLTKVSTSKKLYLFLEKYISILIKNLIKVKEFSEGSSTSLLF